MAIVFIYIENNSFFLTQLTNMGLMQKKSQMGSTVQKRYFVILYIYLLITHTFGPQNVKPYKCLRRNIIKYKYLILI